MNTSFGIKWVGVLLLGTATAWSGWNTGTALPDLSAFKLEGTIPSLSGKVVLVDFWASWCGPCKTSFPALDSLQKDYGTRGLIILAVNQDKTGETMKTFLAEHPVTFTALRDPENRLVATADVASMPSSYLVDRTGKIRFLHRGFHGEKTMEQYRKEIEILLQEKAGGSK